MGWRGATRWTTGQDGRLPLLTKATTELCRRPPRPTSPTDLADFSSSIDFGGGAILTGGDCLQTAISTGSDCSIITVGESCRGGQLEVGCNFFKSAPVHGFKTSSRGKIACSGMCFLAAANHKCKKSANSFSYFRKQKIEQWFKIKIRYLHGRFRNFAPNKMRLAENKIDLLASKIDLLTNKINLLANKIDLLANKIWWGQPR